MCIRDSVKGAEFEKAFPLSRDLEQEDVQDVMDQLQNSSYNKSICLLYTSRCV